MKILQLTYHLAPGGAEHFVVDLCNELSMSSSNEIILLSVNDDKIGNNGYYLHELSNNVKYICLKCKKGISIDSLWRIYKTIREEQPDVVHAHTDAICLFFPAMLYRKARYVHTLHSVASKRIIRPWLQPIYRYYYKMMITPVTISKICEDSYKSFYNLCNSKIIENGRSLPVVTNRYFEVTSEIEKLKKNKDDKVFVHVARCCKAKNQELLINAFNRLINNGYHAILILIGADFEHLINNSSVNKESIYWLGVKNNIADYLKNGDFFVLSSSWEGAPLSLLEAMSIGVIPICTPAGGIPDIIISEKYGYISKDFSLDSYYETLVKAYTLSNHFDKNTLIEYYQENYSMRKCMDNYLMIYEDLVNL